jgi:hypothetical protein
MPEMFNITEESLNGAKDKPYEGDVTADQNDGYFSDVDQQPMREATPGVEQALRMSPEEQRMQMQDFVYTICTALGEFFDVSEKTDITLTEPERQNLGEHWGNVLFHYWTIKTRKGLDIANASAYTTGLGVKKAKEIKDKKNIEDVE